MQLLLHLEFFCSEDKDTVNVNYKKQSMSGQLDFFFFNTAKSGGLINKYLT